LADCSSECDIKATGKVLRGDITGV
jgi:hypothetical protein